MSLELQPDIAEPLAEKSVALRWSIIGLLLCAAAGGIGYASRDPENLNTLNRVAVGLLLLGSFISGCALTLRWNWYLPWFLSSVSALLGTLAIPLPWDSIPLLYHGMMLVTFVIGLLVACFTGIRRAIIGGMICFHFFGISMSILSPPPSPWAVFQIWQRCLTWWFDPIYINNAYQFYAPDPGPANQLWFCIEFFKTDSTSPGGISNEEKAREEFARLLGMDKQAPGVMDDLAPKMHLWIKMPERPRDYRDPLGITYYRELALTEYTYQGTNANYNAFPTEAKEIERRRQAMRSRIPLHNELLYPTMQYRPPSNLVTQMIVPSYARHLAHKYENIKPGLKFHTVRIYRVMHRIIEPDVMGDPKNLKEDSREKRYSSVYEPSTYQPFFLGEFFADGTLKDPAEPMLYWALPISRKLNGKFCKFGDDDYYSNYIDSVRTHAGSDHTSRDLIEVDKRFDN